MKPSAYTYADLLARQQELQTLGWQHGHRGFTDSELRLAYLAEVGELIQEFKPLWCWWKTGGEVDREKALSEAADVLHFKLIEILNPEFPAQDWNIPIVVGRLGSLAPNDPYILHRFEALAVAQIYRKNLVYTVRALCDILHTIGYDLDDLIHAYYLKTDENLRRWDVTPA